VRRSLPRPRWRRSLAGAGAAAVAVAAFGAAIIPQIGALSDASEAQKKYEDAVAKSGATSEAAITAQAEFQQQIAKMPSASREAAAGLTTLKKEYRPGRTGWPRTPCPSSPRAWRSPRRCCRS
jgi:hypothetical protein